MRGLHDVLGDVEADLRDYPPLTGLLPDPEAIYEGHPADDRGYSAAVTLTTQFSGSTPHRGVTSREYRIQVTAKATREWREWFDNRDSQPSSHSQLSLILTRVADRMDKAPGLAEISLGGEGGPEPQELDDGRLAVASDWRVAGWYVDKA